MSPRRKSRRAGGDIDSIVKIHDALVGCDLDESLDKIEERVPDPLDRLVRATGLLLDGDEARAAFVIGFLVHKLDSDKIPEENMEWLVAFSRKAESDSKRVAVRRKKLVDGIVETITSMIDIERIHREVDAGKASAFLGGIERLASAGVGMGRVTAEHLHQSVVDIDSRAPCFAPGTPEHDKLRAQREWSLAAMERLGYSCMDIARGLRRASEVLDPENAQGNTEVKP